MRNYFPEWPSVSPLHTLSKLYDVSVGFVTPPLIQGSVLIYLRSPKVGCCSISDNLLGGGGVVTPTDHPKSVRNRCVIELFVALFMFSLCHFYMSVVVGAFVTGLSQISSFFLLF